MNKKQQAEFRKLDVILKVRMNRFMVWSTEKHILTGQDLLEWGYTHDPQDETKPLVPTTKYIFNQPVQTEVNHYRRLKKAFEAEGEEGVRRYARSLLKVLTKVEETVQK